MLVKVRQVIQDNGFDPDSDEDTGNPTWHILKCIKEDFADCIIFYSGLCLVALKRHLDCDKSQGILTKLDEIMDQEEETAFRCMFFPVLQTLEKFERALQTLPSPPEASELEACKDQLLYDVEEEVVEKDDASSGEKRARNE
jgi:hypothetical protein